MPVLTIASSKGGPGKTTVAMLIASTLAREGLQIIALDADPTQALSRWAATAYDGAPFLCIAEPDETRLAHLIDHHADKADLVLVDTAGFGNWAAAVAMTSADLIVIPTLSGEPDITEAEKTWKLADGLARAARRQIPALVLLNKVRRTTLAKHASTEIKAANLPRLDATLSDLVAYGELSYGTRLLPSGPAYAEVAALIAELRAKDYIPTASRNAEAA